MKHKYENAIEVAESIITELKPACKRICLAGSLRRGKDLVGDIDVVLVPKPYEFGLLESGIATIINQWPKLKGELNKKCKLTRRAHPSGIEVDFYIVNEDNYGYHLAIRTGSESFNKSVLTKTWIRKGFKGMDGYLTKDGKQIPVYEEIDLFKLIQLLYVEPSKR